MKGHHVVIWSRSPPEYNQKLMGKDTFACFVDFHKAFDSVDRDLLWHKLSQYGISGKFLNSLTAMYAETECAVEVNHKCTSYFKVSCGVKQGCLLSPALFNIFINDLLMQLSESNLGIQCGSYAKVSVLAYADDIVLLAPNPSSLQSLIDKLNVWCMKNRIAINTSKTKVIHFRNKRHSCSTFEFKCGNLSLDYCSEYKYLGFWINQHLDISLTLQKVSLASRKSLACLIAKAKTVGGFPYDTFYYLYHSLVAPILDYSSCIWGYEERSILERTQNGALRFFLSAGVYHPIRALQGDMGWIPDCYRHYYEVFKWWLKLRSYDQHRIARRVLVWSTELAEKGLKNWCWRIKKMSVALQMHDEYLYSLALPDDGLVETVAPLVKKKLLHIANNEWIEKLNKPSKNTETGGKLRYYKLIKTDPTPAHFVLAPLTPGQRWVLASLRAGCLPMAVETGRYRSPKVPLAERLCNVCSEGAVEDELHFVTYCKPLSTERQVLFLKLADLNSDFLSLSNFDKLIFIMHAEDCTTIIARGLYKMYQLRMSLLYKVTTQAPSQ